MGVTALSASSIRDYKNCPLLFYYRHVLKLRLPQKQLNLVFGGAVHNGIEVYHNTNDVEEAIAKFKKSFQFIRLAPEERNEYYPHKAEGERLIREYVAHQPYMTDVYGIDPNGVSETKFEKILVDPFTGEELTMPIRGRIDRVTATGQVVEYKTSKKKYKQDETDLLDQATIYSWVTELDLQREIEGVYYVVFLKGRKSDPIQILKTKRTKEDYVRLFRETKNIIKQIEKGRFERGCSGYKAKWCDCRKYEEALEI